MNKYTITENALLVFSALFMALLLAAGVGWCFALAKIGLESLNLFEVVSLGVLATLGLFQWSWEIWKLLEGMRTTWKQKKNA